MANDEIEGELSTACYEASKSWNPASRAAHEKCNGWADRARETECTCWHHTLDE